jgi:hypothetical protein
MWSQEELDKIQKLLLSVDEGNQLFEGTLCIIWTAFIGTYSEK